MHIPPSKDHGKLICSNRKLGKKKKIVAENIIIFVFFFIFSKPIREYEQTNLHTNLLNLSNNDAFCLKFCNSHNCFFPQLLVNRKRSNWLANENNRWTVLLHTKLKNDRYCEPPKQHKKKRQANLPQKQVFLFQKNIHFIY